MIESAVESLSLNLKPILYDDPRKLDVWSFFRHFTEYQMRIRNIFDTQNSINWKENHVVDSEEDSVAKREFPSSNPL